MEQSRLRDLRVLVVEDESIVRMLIEDMLGDMGCDVVGVAWTLNDAMEKAKSLEFDVAILDVNLNNSDTGPVAQIVRARGIPFVFATGYGPAGIPKPFHDDVPILGKPFQQSDLESILFTTLVGQAG